MSSSESNTPETSAIGTQRPCLTALEQLSDDALLERCRASDPQALDLLLRRHYDTIRAFAFRLCGNLEECEEVTQESLVKIARSIRNFRSQAKLSTWFYQITLNVVRDRSRARKRRERTRERAKAEADLQPQSISPTATSKEVLQALEQLSDKEREAAVLVFFQDYSHAEAAEVLGCAETTISWRLFCAKRKLKAFLMEHAQ